MRHRKRSQAMLPIQTGTLRNLSRDRMPYCFSIKDRPHCDIASLGRTSTCTRACMLLLLIPPNDQMTGKVALRANRVTGIAAFPVCVICVCFAFVGVAHVAVAGAPTRAQRQQAGEASSMAGRQRETSVRVRCVQEVRTTPPSFSLWARRLVLTSQRV